MEKVPCCRRQTALLRKSYLSIFLPRRAKTDRQGLRNPASAQLLFIYSPRLCASALRTFDAARQRRPHTRQPRDRRQERDLVAWSERGTKWRKRVQSAIAL